MEDLIFLRWVGAITSLSGDLLDSCREFLLGSRDNAGVEQVWVLSMFSYRVRMIF